KVDDQQSIATEGFGAHDHRDPLLQEEIGGDQTAGLPGNAGSIMAVIAQVGSNEDEVWRGGFGSQILWKPVEIDDVAVAIGRVDDGVEVDKRIVPRSVLVASRNRE